MATATKPRPSARAKTPAALRTPDEPARTITYLDPATITRDECNARETDTEPDEDLLNSVREIGVEDAVSVRPRPDGTYGAFKGWRRAQALQVANSSAAQDKRPQRKIPAIIRQDLVGRDGWTRMLSLIENDHRQQMSEHDKLKSIELSLVDMSEVEQNEAIRVLGVTRNAVKNARRAAKLSDRELRTASAQGMDLEQLADSAEVADVPGAEGALAQAHARDATERKGGRGHWDQAMAQLRLKKADADARAKALQSLKEAGVPLLPSSFSYYEKDMSRPLTELTTPLGSPLTGESHAKCPGHCARLDEEYQPVWHCRDPKEYSHKVRPEARAAKKPMDPAALAERNRVIEGNRAWAAAQNVRKEFMSRICQSKTLPDAARLFAFRTVVSAPAFYAKWVDGADHKAVADLLGFTGEAYGAARKHVIRVGESRRSAFALFAHAAAACEASLSVKKVWMHLDEAQTGYLLTYESLGGTLSEVERIATARYRPAPAPQAGKGEPAAATAKTAPVS
jgi:ParB-like chromosome segregation protein Spo0J